jgi:hypothetical protein
MRRPLTEVIVSTETQWQHSGLGCQRIDEQAKATTNATQQLIVMRKEMEWPDCVD